MGIICGSVGVSGIGGIGEVGGIGGIKEGVFIRWGSVGRSVVVDIDIWCGPFSSMCVGIISGDACGMSSLSCICH